jgi:hypothetical protein
MKIEIVFISLLISVQGLERLEDFRYCVQLLQRQGFKDFTQCLNHQFEISDVQMVRKSHFTSV